MSRNPKSAVLLLAALSACASSSYLPRAHGPSVIMRRGEELVVRDGAVIGPLSDGALETLAARGSDAEVELRAASSWERWGMVIGGMTAAGCLTGWWIAHDSHTSTFPSLGIPVTCFALTLLTQWPFQTVAEWKRFHALELLADRPGGQRLWPGDSLTGAVTEVAAAREAADAYWVRKRMGIGLLLAGGIGCSMVVLAAGVGSKPVDKAGWFGICGAVPLFSGLTLLDGAQAKRFDAVNLFNDSKATAK